VIAALLAETSPERWGDERLRFDEDDPDWIV
jgi:hypothetical protein